MELFHFWSKMLTPLHITLLFQIFGKCVSDKIWNKCPLQSDAMRLLPRISMKECLDECQIRNDCQLICYRTATKLCEIHGSSQKSTDCKGCVSVPRNENQFVKPCDCEEGQTCNKLTGSCEYTECGKLSVPSGKTYGNLANVGAKKIIQCYASIEISEESKCTDNGEWENVLSCEDICPSSEKIFTLTDGLQIKLCSREVLQEDAKRYCIAMGGALVKLDEEDKMIAIREIISDDPDLTNNDYWVDGYSEIAEDLDGWKFSDGTQMSMDKGVFWAPSSPNGGNGPSCVRMRRSVSHLLDDRDCSLLFHYVCQMH